MFNSEYNKIKKDFSFLNKYGFYFSYIVKHYVAPSVVFSNGYIRMQIGMNYEDRRIFVTLYEYKKQLLRSNILENVALIGTSYKSQIAQAVAYLDNYCKTRFVENT